MPIETLKVENAEIEISKSWDHIALAIAADGEDVSVAYLSKEEVEKLRELLKEAVND